MAIFSKFYSKVCNSCIVSKNTFGIKNSVAKNSATKRANIRFIGNNNPGNEVEIMTQNKKVASVFMIDQNLQLTILTTTIGL